MINLLCKIFVKDYADTESAVVRQRYGTFVSTLGLVLNICLAASKIAIGIAFGAIAIKADGMNNLFDAFTTTIALISFKICVKPADRHHPFGHARFEYIASMIVAFIIFHFGIDLVTESIEKIISGESDTTFSIISVVVLCISITIKLFMYIMNTSVGKKINSSIMRATATDSLSDIIATSGVLISILALHFANVDIDAYMGIVIAFIIFYNGIKIFNDTKDSILGEQPDKEIISKVKKIVSQYPQALGTHDMFFHNYGAGRCIMSMHIEVDGMEDVFATHDIIDNIEKQIYSELSIKCTVHMDPIVTDDNVLNDLHKKVSAKISLINGKLHIHDFRFVKGVTHSNLIFDIAAPFELDISDEDIISEANKKVREIDKSYNAVVTVDRE